MSTLEDRIRRLEDRAEIQDLVAMYFRAVDDDDAADLADCLTHDVHFSASGFGGADGKHEVLALLAASRAAMLQTVHTPNYAHVTLIDENGARGLVMAHLEMGIGGTTAFAAVRYQDEYRRDDGRWRIASRKMGTVHAGSWDSVASSLTDPLNVRWPGTSPVSSDFPRPRREQTDAPR